MNALVANDSITPWMVGYTIGLVVVLVVVALVVPILLLARKIGRQAADIDASLGDSVRHTAALAQLGTTIESAETIVAGLARGRNRLGG